MAGRIEFRWNLRRVKWLNKEHAQKLLELKEKGYPNPSVVLFGKTKVHLFRWLCLAILLLPFFLTEDSFIHSVFSLVLAFVAGAFVKEFIFMVKIQKNWPTTMKFTNWELVEEVAQKETWSKCSVYLFSFLKLIKLFERTRWYSFSKFSVSSVFSVVKK